VTCRAARHIDDLLTAGLWPPALPDPPRLPHTDSRRYQAPRGRFVCARPVHGPEPRKPALQCRHHPIPLPDPRPSAAVDIEAEDAGDLVLDVRSGGRAVHLAGRRGCVVLRATDPDRLPVT